MDKHYIRYDSEAMEGRKRRFERERYRPCKHRVTFGFVELGELNAEYIKLGLKKGERLKKLKETGIYHMGLFSNMNILKRLAEK